MKAPTLTLHGSYIGALDIILEFSKLFLEVVKRHEFVLCVFS
jgi:hypothetical protein